MGHRYELVTWDGQWTDDAHGDACTSDDRWDILFAAQALIDQSDPDYTESRFGIRDTESGEVEEISGLWPLEQARIRRRGDVLVPIYNQNCIEAGRLCIDEEQIEAFGEEDPSHDLTMYYGSTAELAEQADDLEAAAEKAGAGADVYYLRSARTIRRVIGTDQCPNCIRAGHTDCSICGTEDACKHRPHMVACGYCGAETPCSPVPEVDDDDGWAEQAEGHEDDCVWVATRRYRRAEAL